MKQKIVFQYFDGCPHSTETLKNLQTVLNRNEFNFELEIMEVSNPEVAKKVNFQGSPTVLIDNVDIYTEEVPSTFNYSCRIFNIRGHHTGVLSTDYLYEKLIKLGVTLPGK